MKILAIIPARAESKGIPNKNIRIIGERPMIYYSIRNSKNSRFITKTIVTTDSPEVRIIAKQMGVEVHDEPDYLSNDDITLDAVVFEAIDKSEQWDYIITIQPTSPTLTVKTLDSAIEYAIDNNLDTLISAINAPHLSWGVKDNMKVPNYEKRLNRQFLPPCYMETGAFLISKASVVTENTRIGEKVDVFELEERESYDVDSFPDLLSVAAVIECERIGIYVNGNDVRGMGHIYRALDLADEFYTKPDIIFDKNQTSPKAFGNTTHTIIPVDGAEELFELCKKNNYDIFINDILSTSIEYMEKLRTILPKAKLVNFEDDGDGQIKADLVINALLYDNRFANVKTGEKYYISGKTFMFYNPISIKERVESILITFGGSDPQKYTERLLSIITNDIYRNYRFTVILGRAKNNVEELLCFNRYENIDVLYDIPDMPEIMVKNDIAVTSRGRTCYELALLGIPTIAMAQNETEEKHGFVADENGFAYIGFSPEEYVIEKTLREYINLSQIDRKIIQERLLSHDLRNGRKRVMNLINSL